MRTLFDNRRNWFTVMVTAATVLYLTSCAALLGKLAFQHEPTEAPALVGYGCEGADGPLYAVEEDHFPRCERIEVR
jgi:hypothetical protein